MSSSEDEHSSAQPKSKKRRLPRACDACRRKKTKCNSAEMPNDICSNCISQGVPCLHTIPNKKRGVNREYVTQLEQRLQDTEDLLRRLHPDRDFTQELGPPSLDHASSSARSSTSPPVEQPPASLSVPTGPVDPMSYLPESTHYGDEEREDATTVEISQRLRKMHIQTADERYFGKASQFALMTQAIGMKEMLEGTPSQSMMSGKFKREQYWTITPWEKTLRQADVQNRQDFPEPDLLDNLVSLYMLRMNSFFPILHGPTLRQNIKDQLHLKDYYFGRLVLMICAVGSRFSDDPRVTLDPQHPNWLTSGFQWFAQVKLLESRYLLDLLSLTDVQVLCVGIIYHFGMTIPQGGWTVLGVAIRSCIERGIHQRLPSGGKSTKTFADEMWKRVFWFLVSVDRQIMTFLGRPSTIASEEIEIDFPEECDDEHWLVQEDGSITFQQPPDVPALSSGFNVHLKLCELYAVAMRTLYASAKSRALFGVTGDNWESRIVTELDSSLNSWLDSVPEHLRWDPHRSNPIHFDQSCLIYTVYYGLQIQIHRPFIDKKKSPLAFPSLAICTNSSRSCSHVLEVQTRRGTLRLPHVQMTAYTSALVLLMNVYGAKRLNINIDPTKELAAVDSLRRYLEACDSRWHLAGRFADIIAEMAHMHVTPPAATPTLKRVRSEDVASFSTFGGESSFTADGSQFPVDYGSTLPNSLADVPIPFAPMAENVMAQDAIATDWNINPYAFPSMPTTEAYPSFHVDPSMTQPVFGIEELQRLSSQIAEPPWSAAPTTIALDEWNKFISSLAAQ